MDGLFLLTLCLIPVLADTKNILVVNIFKTILCSVYLVFPSILNAPTITVISHELAMNVRVTRVLHLETHFLSFFIVITQWDRTVYSSIRDAQSPQVSPIAVFVWVSLRDQWCQKYQEPASTARGVRAGELFLPLTHCSSSVWKHIAALSSMLLQPEKQEVSASHTSSIISSQKDLSHL